MSAQPMGLHLDMPMEEYQSIDAMSATGLRLFSRSPWHYRNRVEVTPTKAMLTGTLAHCAVLEPHQMEKRYIVTPDDAPRRPSRLQWNAKKPSPESVLAMEWWTKFNESCEGREIVLAEDYAITQAQLDALAADDELRTLLAHGAGEVSVFWIDKQSGVYCKARPDWMHPVAGGGVKLLDLKSTVDDTPEGFSRSAARLGYHRQQAHYVDGFQQATGLKVVDFVFAAVSSTPPVLAIPYRFVDEVLQQGEEECAELLAQYALCRSENRWPAYSPEARMIDLPKWAKPNKEVEVSYAE